MGKVTHVLDMSQNCYKFVPFQMLCAFWYNLCNLKNVKKKNPWRSVQTLACDFSKNNTPRRMFFTFFKLQRPYQIAQSTSYTDISQLICSANQQGYYIYIYIYILSGFSFTDTDDSQDSREGREPSFIPLYHFHLLTNIETFICNFVCEMTITCF